MTDKKYNAFKTSLSTIAIELSTVMAEVKILREVIETSPELKVTYETKMKNLKKYEDVAINTLTIKE